MTRTSLSSRWYWCALGLGVLALSISLSRLSHRFSEEVAGSDLPNMSFIVALLLGSGLVVYTIPKLLRSGDVGSQPAVFFFILGIGLCARLVHFGAVPILEDDYQRYLWDGAVLAKGLSPYLYAPLAFLNADVDAPAYWDLAETAWPVLERINHPEYRTVYPVVAQIAFALSNWIAPLSLDGWRAVLLLSELGVVALLIGLLRRLQLNLLWVSLYWLHPLAIKEIANSAHLEPIIMVFVLAGLWAAMDEKPRLAAVFLALGFGVKIWPILLMAPVLWSMRAKPFIALQAALIFGFGALLLMWLVIAAGLNESSGFVAFARGWAASSAAFLASEFVANGLSTLIGVNAPQMLSRLLLGVILGATIILACLRQPAGANGMAQSFFVITAALFLVSPSVTPWYALWLLPFLCLFPNRALLGASVLIGLHYTYFPLALRDLGDLYRYGMVWLIWLPVWAVLAWDYFNKEQSYA